MALGLGLNLPLTRQTGAPFVGFLDAYPGALRAYSLRRLKTEYTGSLIRVRRSSDNTELDIGYTSAGMLDSAAMLTFVGAGNGFVTRWYDQSANGQDAVQTTAAAQPQIVSSGSIVVNANNTPSIQCDGVDDYFTFVSPGGSTRSAFIVMSQVTYDTVNRKRIIGENRFTSSSDNAGYIFEARGDLVGDPLNLNLQNNGLADLSATSGIQIGTSIFSILINSSASVEKNAASIISGSGTIGSSYTAGSIGGSTVGTLTINAKFSEVIIYNTNQSANRAGITANLNSYYGFY